LLCDRNMVSTIGHASTGRRQHDGGRYHDWADTREFEHDSFSNMTRPIMGHRKGDDIL